MKTERTSDLIICAPYAMSMPEKAKSGSSCLTA
jgi:hypothetical protein